MFQKQAITNGVACFLISLTKLNLLYAIENLLHLEAAANTLTRQLASSRSSKV